MSFQLVFLFGRSPVMLQTISSVRCWNMILPATISSLISSSRSFMSSGAIERHLCRLTPSIILLMTQSRFFIPVSLAIVIVQQKCSTSFSLSLSTGSHLFPFFGAFGSYLNTPQVFCVNRFTPNKIYRGFLLML